MHRPRRPQGKEPATFGATRRRWLQAVATLFMPAGSASTATPARAAARTGRGAPKTAA